MVTPTCSRSTCRGSSPASTTTDSRTPAQASHRTANGSPTSDHRARTTSSSDGSTDHSYGGILTNWLITRYPDRFRAAVSGAGASNWTSNYAHSDVARTKELEFLGRPWEPRAQEVMIRQSAYLNSGGVQAATLFVHGEVDYRVPLEGAIQLYTSLKKQGVPAELIVYDGQSHGIRGHWNNVHRMMNELRWWETYLKPVARVLTSDRH